MGSHLKQHGGHGLPRQLVWSVQILCGSVLACEPDWCVRVTGSTTCRLARVDQPVWSARLALLPRELEFPLSLVPPCRCFSRVGGGDSHQSASVSFDTTDRHEAGEFASFP